MKSSEENYFVLNPTFLFVGILLFGLAAAIAIWPLYALLLLAALIFGIICFIQPRLVTYLLVLSFPFIAAIPRGSFLPGLKLDEILIIVGLAVGFLNPGIKKTFRFTMIDALYIALFLESAILPMIGHSLRGWPTEWLEVVAILKGYLIYRLILLTMNRRQDVQRCLLLLLIPVPIVLVIGIFQLLGIANMSVWLREIYGAATFSMGELGARANVFRATATLGNWNGLGGYAAMIVLVGLPLFVETKAISWGKFTPLALASGVSNLIVAGSSSSIVGMLVGGVVSIFSVRRLRISRRLVGYSLIILLVGGIVFAIVGRQVLSIQFLRQTSEGWIHDRAGQSYVYVPNVPDSLVVRLYLAKYLFEVMRRYDLAILTGFGDNEQTRALLPWGTPESGYISMWFFYGPFFILIYLSLMAAIFVQARKTGKNSLRMNDRLGVVLAKSTMGMVAAIFVMNIVSSYYISAGATHVFWIVAGCLMVVDSLKYDEADKQI